MGKKKDSDREKRSSKNRSSSASSTRQSRSSSATRTSSTTSDTAHRGTSFSRPTAENTTAQRTPKHEQKTSQRQQNIQRALKGTGTSQEEVPDQVLDVIGGGGMPLDMSIQRSLEDRMDADFSDVRIHTGGKAAQAADAIDAKAFTCGNDIVFNAGEYDPQSAEGQHLLAHELAHVKQQNGGAPLSMKPKANADLEIDPDPQLEREADKAAQEALSDGPVTINRMGTDVHIQRVPGSEAISSAVDSAKNALGIEDEKKAEEYIGEKVDEYLSTVEEGKEQAQAWGNGIKEGAKSGWTSLDQGLNGYPSTITGAMAGAAAKGGSGKVARHGVNTLGALGAGLGTMLLTAGNPLAGASAAMSTYKMTDDVAGEAVEQVGQSALGEAFVGKTVEEGTKEAISTPDEKIQDLYNKFNSIEQRLDEMEKQTSELGGETKF